jgi:hypothetical protein
MLRQISTTSTHLAAIETYTPERQIIVGDFVYVYDGVKEQYIWQQVAAVKVENERQKIKVCDTDFYFDEGLVAAVAYLTGGGV